MPLRVKCEKLERLMGRPVTGYGTGSDVDGAAALVAWAAGAR